MLRLLIVLPEPLIQAALRQQLRMVPHFPELSVGKQQYHIGLSHH